MTSNPALTTTIDALERRSRRPRARRRPRYGAANREMAHGLPPGHPSRRL